LTRAELVALRITEAKSLASLQVEKADIEGQRKVAEADLGPSSTPSGFAHYKSVGDGIVALGLSTPAASLACASPPLLIGPTETVRHFIYLGADAHALIKTDHHGNCDLPQDVRGDSCGNRGPHPKPSLCPHRAVRTAIANAASLVKMI
jgi:hypothetical protein